MNAVQALDGEGTVALTVTHTGCGMSEEFVLESLFVKEGSGTTLCHASSVVIELPSSPLHRIVDPQRAVAKDRIA